MLWLRNFSLDKWLVLKKQSKASNWCSWVPKPCSFHNTTQHCYFPGYSLPSRQIFFFFTDYILYPAFPSLAQILIIFHATAMHYKFHFYDKNILSTRCTMNIKLLPNCRIFRLFLNFPYYKY